MTDHQEPEPCPDPWCEGAMGHAECVGRRMAWEMRDWGVSTSELIGFPDEEHPRD